MLDRDREVEEVSERRGKQQFDERQNCCVSGSDRFLIKFMRQTKTKRERKDKSGLHYAASCLY